MAHLGGTTSIFARTVDAYRQAAAHAGFDPATLPITTAGFFHVAETSQKALQNTYRYMNEGMIRTNGQGLSKQMYAQNIYPMSIANMGSPQQVIENILHQHEVFGHQRYIGQIDFGGVPFDEVMKQIDIIGEEILPAIRKYTAAGAKAQDEEKDN
ncbi:LLM class flavin-dependent oxidoreductase, partial [Corynebacterium casei]|uniref:LLM class flavin-dependent oxidoreductase n=1 Tax=Corynebacterium casei TaxID=160386 RepID=UPI003FD54DFA